MACYSPFFPHRFLSPEQGHRLTERHVKNLPKFYYGLGKAYARSSLWANSDGVSADHVVALPSLSDAGDFASVEEREFSDDLMDIDDGGLGEVFALGRDFDRNLDVTL